MIITCRVSVIDYESFLIHGFMESTTYHPCLNITLIPKVWFVFRTAPSIKIMISKKQMMSTTYHLCRSITFISKVNWKYFQNTCMINERVLPRLPFSFVHMENVIVMIPGQGSVGDEGVARDDEGWGGEPGRASGDEEGQWEWEIFWNDLYWPVSFDGNEFCWIVIYAILAFNILNYCIFLETF